MKPHISFYIDYIIENSKELIQTNVKLFLGSNNLTNDSGSLDKHILSTTKKIDMQKIKNQAYLKLAKRNNFDATTGTTIEESFCANLELQKQDSLLHIELDSLINKYKFSGDTISLQNVLLSPELWESYRYSQCSSCVTEGNRFDMILFMKCATNLTIKRRADIKLFCGYNNEYRPK
ncbi:MAG: hypothetical protein Q8R57_14510 [Bacteroidota bacterium]|nr:hypothetical protein [Bacteroidota bacterium]